MQGQLQINDQNFEVSTESKGDVIEVKVGAQTFQVDLKTVEHGFVGAILGEDVHLALENGGHSSLRGGESMSLPLDDVAFDVKFTRARKASASATTGAMGAEGDENSITAFMPGTIVRIDVEEGQEVEQGQVLLILEAMKMENEIKAPRNCVVEAVHTTTGANVNKGELLLQLSD
jgi:pyruvate carboxylase